jgi:hypothetical protein
LLQGREIKSKGMGAREEDGDFISIFLLGRMSKGRIK